MKLSKTLIGTAAALLLACSGSQAADVWRLANNATPDVALPVPSPQVLSPAGEGRRAFLRFNCYGCHGMFAAGAMGPGIVGAERHDVSEAVLRGEEGGMPSFRAYVTDTDITNLTAYLNSIGKPSEPVFMDWWKKVPPK